MLKWTFSRHKVLIFTIDKLPFHEKSTTRYVVTSSLIFFLQSEDFFSQLALICEKNDDNNVTWIDN